MSTVLQPSTVAHFKCRDVAAFGGQNGNAKFADVGEFGSGRMRRRLHIWLGGAGKIADVGNFRRQTIGTVEKAERRRQMRIRIRILNLRSNANLALLGTGKFIDVDEFEPLEAR